MVDLIVEPADHMWWFFADHQASSIAIGNGGVHEGILANLGHVDPVVGLILKTSRSMHWGRTPIYPVGVWWVHCGF